MTEHIIVDDKDAVRVIAMNRPEKKNALTNEMYDVMAKAITSAQGDDTIRCLMITGTRDAFCAGNDLRDFAEVGSGAKQDGQTAASRFVHALLNNAKPLVAAVEGVAIGIGTTLILHCDYVVAGAGARFATPFVSLGLVPEGGSSVLMPAVIGYQRAFATLVMGHAMDADAACRAGFVNTVTSAGEAEAEGRKAALEIAALPPQAVAISRRLLRQPEGDLFAQLDRETKLFDERLQSDEAKAAFDRFLKRRSA